MFWSLEAQALRSDELRFTSVMKAIEYDLDRQMATYMHALDGGVALYHTTPDVPRRSWRAFAEALNLLERYPGIRGIGVIYVVPRSEKDSFEQKARADDYPDFSIKRVANAQPVTRQGGDELFVITYVEPVATNLPALGLDTASEQHRLEGAEASRDMAATRMTRRIQLVQDGVRRPGFLLFAPFYRTPQPPASVDERRQQIRGWIYAPFVTEEFLRSSVDSTMTRELEFSVYDGESADDATLLYRSNPERSTREYERVSRFRMAGQTFTIGWNRGISFSAASRAGAVWAGGLSFGFSILLGVLVWSLLSADRKSKQLVAIQEAEIELQKFALDQHAIVAITDLKGRITYANDRFCQVSGYTREELIGKTHAPLKSGLHDAAFYRDLFGTISNGRVWRGEVCNRRKNGELYWMAATIVPQLSPTGKPVKYIAIRTDITALKQAEEQQRRAESALREAAQRLRLAAEAAEIGVWDWDVQQNVVLWDARMFTIYGMPLRSDGRIPYSDWTERVLPEDLPTQESALRATIEERGQGQRTFRVRRLNDGCVRYIQAQEIVLMDEAGKAIRVIGVNRDVTESTLEAEKRRDLEQNLEKARDEALAASRLKSEFLATVSHEIRTPMNGILGMARLLALSPLEKKQHDMAGVLVRSAESLLTIINDILDLSKIEAGKMRIAPVDFNLRAAVEETAAIMSPEAHRKGLRFVVSLPPEIATGVQGDSGRIQQILTNLLGNAFKFTERGEVRLFAEVLPSAPSTLSFRIAISDTGIGIPESARSKLFQPFVQADASTTRRFGGTGLGLSICAQLITLMHGKLDFESTEGVGSRFWFELALPRVALPTTSTPASRPPTRTQIRGGRSNGLSADARSGGGRSLRILLAEDNETNQIVARHLIEDMGHSLTVANDGAEALRWLEQESFDAILMDCQMPVLDGYATTARIRAGKVLGADPDIPIIALTAYAMPVDQARAAVAGMDDYVAKPVSSSSLHEAFVRCGLEPPESAPAASSSASPAPPAAPPAAPVIDEGQRQRLRSIPTADGLTVWDRAARVFLEQTPGRVAALAEHVALGRLPEAAVVAHTLAGSAASIGAPQLQAAARALETAARENDSSRSPALLADVTSAWSALRQAFDDSSHS